MPTSASVLTCDFSAGHSVLSCARRSTADGAARPAAPRGSAARRRCTHSDRACAGCPHSSTSAQQRSCEYSVRQTVRNCTTDEVRVRSNPRAEGCSNPVAGSRERSTIFARLLMSQSAANPQIKSSLLWGTNLISISQTRRSAWNTCWRPCRSVLASESGAAASRVCKAGGEAHLSVTPWMPCRLSSSSRRHDSASGTVPSSVSRMHLDATA